MGPRPWKDPPIAVFWDQSLVWGLLCCHTLGILGIPFRILTGKEIASGALDRYRVLVVPGGWASHKVRALGDSGRQAIISFIEEGGGYLGFCGGAGLALSSQPSLGILPLQRKAFKDRLPNVSGEVWIQLEKPARERWQGLPSTLPVSIWWPSQFGILNEHIQIVAAYVGFGRDLYIADIPVDDTSLGMESWTRWEKEYGINLNPERILGEPAIIEAKKGLGRLILSYPHLETPNDPWGNHFFHHILRDLSSTGIAVSTKTRGSGKVHGSQTELKIDQKAWFFLKEASETAQAFIEYGESNLLWRWRRPWLLQWQRGMRGLEYGTLAFCLRWLVETWHSDELPSQPSRWTVEAERVARLTQKFCETAKILTLEEKAASQSGGLGKLQRINPIVDQLRLELFGQKMNHGGLSRSLFNTIDRLLCWSLKGKTSAPPHLFLW